MHHWPRGDGRPWLDHHHATHGRIEQVNNPNLYPSSTGSLQSSQKPNHPWSMTQNGRSFRCYDPWGRLSCNPHLSNIGNCLGVHIVQRVTEPFLELLNRLTWKQVYPLVKYQYNIESRRLTEFLFFSTSLLIILLRIIKIILCSKFNSQLLAKTYITHNTLN